MLRQWYQCFIAKTGQLGMTSVMNRNTAVLSSAAPGPGAYGSMSQGLPNKNLPFVPSSTAKGKRAPRIK